MQSVVGLTCKYMTPSCSECYYCERTGSLWNLVPFQIISNGREVLAGTFSISQVIKLALTGGNRRAKQIYIASTDWAHIHGIMPF